MASIELENEICKYALDFQKRREFVSVVCGAEYRDTRICNKSGLLIADHDFYPLLRTKLNEYGNIGDKVCGTSIGCCAEVNASNEIYKTHKMKLNKISLSKAYRPKTMQERKKCIICNMVFSLS